MSSLDPFTTFQHQAFRLEQLPYYKIADEEMAFDMFRQSGSIPNGFNQEWVEQLHQVQQRGGMVRRLRLVSEPLSEYERFELLAAYKQNTAAGEDIRVALRGTDYDMPTADFWLYDDKIVEWMEYSSHGEYLGSQQRQVVEADKPGLAAAKRLFERSPTVEQFCQSQQSSF